MRSAACALVAFLLLTGCAGPTSQVLTPQAGGTPTPAEEVVLVEVDSRLPRSVLVLGDVLCTLGGGVQLSRIEDRWITEGHGAIKVRVEAPTANTGTQIGYALDEGEVTWLPPVTLRAQEFLVSIPPGAHEAGEERWTFLFQQNPEGASSTCYTGAALELSFKIMAIPAGTADA